MSERFFIMPFMWPDGVEPQEPQAPDWPRPYVDIVARGDWPDHVYDVILQHDDRREVLATYSCFYAADEFAEEHYRHLYIDGSP